MMILEYGVYILYFSNKKNGGLISRKQKFDGHWPKYLTELLQPLMKKEFLIQKQYQLPVTT